MENRAVSSTASKEILYLKTFIITLASLLLFTILIILPYSLWWLYESGDAGMERAIEAQAKGQFALFGSGLSQDFVDYKLHLYEAIRPQIIALGSSRVMQFRADWFSKPFLNMGGVAGNLAVLRSTLEAMLAIARPDAIILGLDFWWFLPQWEKDPTENVPPTSGSYNYSLDSLKKPWEWLLDGKISFTELGAPVLGFFGKGFRTDRFGIMAQQTNDGFGPDGSWYYTAEITGQRAALDWQFRDTLQNVKRGIRAFYHAASNQTGPEHVHLEVLAKILHTLKDHNIHVYIFIPPLAAQVLASMNPREYPHLFRLNQELDKMGITAVDYTDPAILQADDCEFVDGFHGGEVAYARILRSLAQHWPSLHTYVNMEKLNEIILAWHGHALIADDRITSRPETDFLGLNCIKRPDLKALK